uniref:Response regulatory domain-containing protein n=1 Tax=Triticum urartu TaxID=4572 RepID=A0A8R7UTV0_TRIUA
MVGAGEGGRAGGSGAGVGGGQPFVDRSKVRILLCDSDPDSSRDVLRLLCNCSYQVTCAKSPRQVINMLNCEGAEIDIILAEVDLPVSKCFKMLKYIGRNKELRHIPIISKLSSSSHSSVQFLCHACSNDIVRMQLRSDVQQRRGFCCCQVLAARGSRVPGQAASHE